MQDPGTIADRVEGLSRLVTSDHATGRVMIAGQTGDVRLVQASGGERRDTPQPAGQRNTEGEITRSKGITDPGTVARRIEDIEHAVTSWLVLQSGNALGKPVEVRPDGSWGLAGYAHLSDSARSKGFKSRVRPEIIADHVERLPGVGTIGVYHGDARDLVLVGDHSRTVVYFDPPYLGRTGYGWDLPREEVLAFARGCSDTGAVVVVSEAEPLDLGPGWFHVELTHYGRKGGGTEWITCNRPSRTRQVRLWGAA
jgi:hypothetical protein